MYMHIVVVCIMREGKRERERQTEKDRGRERNHKNCIVDWQHTNMHIQPSSHALFCTIKEEEGLAG